MKAEYIIAGIIAIGFFILGFQFISRLGDKLDRHFGEEDKR